MNNSNTQTGGINYREVLSRRKLSFLIPFLLITAIGGAIAFLLPPTFRSEATILIERQNIPKDFIETTVIGYVQVQIEQIKQRIATADNLLDMSRRHALYGDLPDKVPEEAVREFAQNFSVAMKDVSATDPDVSGVRRATVSFTVGFSHSDANAARTVANELAESFLVQHKLSRGEQAREVTTFIETEAASLKEQLEVMDAEIADFKQREFAQLPDLRDLNIKLFEKTEDQIARSESRIRQLGDSLEALRAELSLTQPYVDVRTESGDLLLSASNRLSTLTAQYLRLSSRYSAKHPDVIELTREIRALADQTGDTARADEVLTQLIQQQERLRQAKRTLSPEHPEVLSLERSVAALQKGLQTVMLADSPDSLAVPPDNPRYVAIQSEIRTTQSNLDAERENLVELNDNLVDYEERLFKTPDVDNSLKAMTLEQESVRTKFRDLTNKLGQAKLAEQVEAGDNAERFVLTSKAFLPTLPESPNRLAILALTLMLAGITGLLVAAAREFFDKTIRGTRSVTNSLGVPPLVVIPPIPATRTVLRLTQRSG